MELDDLPKEKLKELIHEVPLDPDADDDDLPKLTHEVTQIYILKVRVPRLQTPPILWILRHLFAFRV